MDPLIFFMSVRYGERGGDWIMSNYAYDKRLS